jgi:hypothetical protein
MPHHYGEQYYNWFCPSSAVVGASSPQVSNLRNPESYYQLSEPMASVPVFEGRADNLVAEVEASILEDVHRVRGRPTASSQVFQGQ